jgi:hypothetical protein
MTRWLNSRQMKTSPIRVSAYSSSQRARARSAGPWGKSGGSGWRSSRYSQITVESAKVTRSSTSTGTRRSGLMAENSRPPMNGTMGSISYAIPLRCRHTRTFRTYGER